MSNNINNYDNNSESIYSHNLGDSQNNIDNIIVKLIKGICISDYKKNNKNEGIHYNTIYLNYLKIIIINIPITNLISVGIFSKNSKSSIIRLYLLNIIISFLNYMGDKNEFFKLKQKENNHINKMNNLNFANYLQSKIYDSFLSIPIEIHFGKNIQKVFKKRTLYIKDIFYKNYYLIDLSDNKIILKSESLYNQNEELKILKQQKIWKELLFYAHNLKKDYLKKNKMIFNGLEYQNFFTKIEYKATFPRRTFIIKFLPLFNGMCIIHEYIQLEYRTFLEEEKEKKEYKERNIIYGYDSYDNIFRNTSISYFENEHYVLKQIHFFIIESLFCSNPSIEYFFILNKTEKIYFSEEILTKINELITEYMENDEHLSLYLKSNEAKSYSKQIIKKIAKELYEDYIQINNVEQIIHRSSSAMPLVIQKNNISFISIKVDKINKSNSLQITKNETLIYLFNSIKFNKNINPNDITIDLKDGEKIEKEDANRPSNLIDRNSKPSLRLSDLLSEKISLRPSHEKMKKDMPKNNYPFPKDSDVIEYKNTNDFLINKNKKENDEMSIGGKIKKKYNNKCNQIKSNDNINKKFNININNSLLKTTSGESSMQKFIIDKNSIENINNNDKKDKIFNKETLK